MTEILESEKRLLVESIQGEIETLCLEQGVDSRYVSGNGTTVPQEYELPFGKHYHSDDIEMASEGRQLNNIGELGLLLNRLVRLQGSSTYYYFMDRQGEFKISLDLP